METNKLLTLEEIEELREPLMNGMDITWDSTMRLLATARAYWEMKNDPKTAQETSYHYIGMLRQWLNECRITDSSKMVDNKDIMDWLGIPVPANYRTDREVISEALGVKDDKPHLPTLKVIVEAMKANLGLATDGEQYFFAQEFIQSLEKHLE